MLKSEHLPLSVPIRYWVPIVRGNGSKAESVIWDSVRVENGASVKNSVVMSDCIVDKNSEKISCVLTENKSYPIAV